MYVKSLTGKSWRVVPDGRDRAICGLTVRGIEALAVPESGVCGSCRQVLARRRDAKAGKPLRKDLGT